MKHKNKLTFRKPATAQILTIVRLEYEAKLAKTTLLIVFSL